MLLSYAGENVGEAVARVDICRGKRAVSETQAEDFCRVWVGGSAGLAVGTEEGCWGSRDRGCDAVTSGSPSGGRHEGEGLGKDLAMRHRIETLRKW